MSKHGGDQTGARDAGGVDGGAHEEVLERITDGFFALDEEWRFTYVNGRAEKLLGRSADDLVGENVWDLFEEAVDLDFYDKYHGAMEAQEQVTFTEYYPPLETWFQVRAYPSETGLSVFFEDVTEEKQYEQVMEAIQDGVYVLNRDEEFAMVNDELLEITGYDREELVGQPASILRTESVGEEARELIQEIRDGERTRGTIEHEIRRKDGGTTPVESRFAPYEYGSDEYGRAGVVRDITDRRERERDLERYKRIVETVDDGVYVLDEDRRFQLVNDAFLKLVGRSREEVIGSRASAVFDETFVDQTRQVQPRNTDESEVASLVYEQETADSSRFLECRFATFPDHVSDHLGQVCVVRDITDNKEQESNLRDRVRQQRVAAAFGRQALEDSDLDELFETAVTVVADTLDIEYAKVLELQSGGDELLLRAGTGWRDGLVGSATVSAGRDSRAGHTLVSDGPVIVEDLDAETRFDGPELLTSHGVTSGISVVIGSAENPWGVLGAHTTESRDFDRHDANFVQSIANTLSSAIDRNHHEWALKHQGERLAALNHLNTIVREINHAIAQQSTRQEIEQLVCRRLANSSSYAFAWTGEVDWNREEIQTRHEIGVDGYLDDVTLSIDDGGESDTGPAVEAVRTDEVQVVQNVLADERDERWHDQAREYGFESHAAIPIHYDDTNYGVLCVYSERPDAFQGEEREVLEDLGEIIGHAIQSLERKRILLSDEVVELEVKIENALADLEGIGLGEEWMRIDRVVPTGEDEYLYYGEISDRDQFEPFVESHPRILDGHFLDDDSSEFVVTVRDSPVMSEITSHGGRLGSAKIEGGDFRITIQLPPNVEARKVLDPIRESYSDVETIAQRHVSQADEQVQSAVFSLEDLTDRQRTMLEAAYFGGYFEWPRTSSAEEVAERMDVSPPTFHEHLRRAQQKVFSALFEEA